jgi:hypothetical protein
VALRQDPDRRLALRALAGVRRTKWVDAGTAGVLDDRVRVEDVIIRPRQPNAFYMKDHAE